MENTPDLSSPCSTCNRYTCRCAEEVTELGQQSRLTLAGMQQPGATWAPWWAAQAANA